ncbi:glycosyltransferase family 4 protein [Dechloromonas sp. ARDL1]|uniref:glycosyltransferase family 4 protein n=1 Tax=Dechloromonas sp. ARDL1 TaxID=3322121 RepID=UPI003DA746FC
MTIRLALVRQRYNPFGGAERFVATTLEALMRKNDDLSLTLITRKWSGGELKHGVIECAPPYLGRLGRDRSFARCVQRTLARERFDLVQSHERIAGCDIFRAGDGVHAAWLEQRSRQQSLLGRIGTALSPWHRYTLAAERAMFADPRLRAVICISELVRDDIRRFYGVPEQKLHVIYNGIDLERYHPGLALEHRAEVRRQHGIPEAAPLFVYVGSGFERKGVAPLLAALSRAQATDSHLVVVGADKKLESYRQQAERLGLAERVVFTGGIKNVLPYYGAADAFVLPTLYEPLSNAVLEALACGLPCIVSDHCGAAELIEPGVNGHVCDALDVAALSAHLDRLAQPGVAAGMREAARAAVGHLGLAAMSERLLGLYRSLL